MWDRAWILLLLLLKARGYVYVVHVMVGGSWHALRRSNRWQHVLRRIDRWQHGLRRIARWQHGLRRSDKSRRGLHGAA